MKVSDIKYLGNPMSKKKNISLAQKPLIVAIAYSGENQVKPTARKYGIDPAQIRRWKRKIDEQNAAVAAPLTDSEGVAVLPNTMTMAKVAKRNQQLCYTRFYGGGRRNKFSNATIAHLKEFFDNKRKNNFSVALKTITREVKRVDPDNCEGESRRAIDMRVGRLLKRWDKTRRRCTHKAQKTRLSDAVMEDFRCYVRERAKMYGIEDENIYNQIKLPFSSARIASTHMKQ
jgi:transposase-like protein